MASRALMLKWFPRLRKKFPEPARNAALGFKKWKRKSKRDYAYADLDTNTVWFHSEATEDLSEDQAVGLICHELGHLADVDIDEPRAEKRADRLAEKYTGHHINYDDDDVETIGPGWRTRPAHLHQ